MASSTAVEATVSVAVREGTVPPVLLEEAVVVEVLVGSTSLRTRGSPMPRDRKCAKNAPLSDAGIAMADGAAWRSSIMNGPASVMLASDAVTSALRPELVLVLVAVLEEPLLPPLVLLVVLTSWNASACESSNSFKCRSAPSWKSISSVTAWSVVGS